MSLLRRMLAHFPLFRLPTREDPKSRRARAVIREADRILEDYRKQDAALRLVIVKKR